MRNISFISANYVARALDYNGANDWGAHDRATTEAASPHTFEAMAGDIVAAGFGAIDIWTAHCHWKQHAEGDFAGQVRDICSRLGLEVTSYAGGFQAQSAEDFDAVFSFMNRLGAPIFAGGISSALPNDELAAMADDACRRHGVRWAFENHPEKTPDEILARIAGGRHDHCGVALDTVWCGIHRMDALDAVRRVREHLFILHLKDVVDWGSHDTCALGEGVVPVEDVVRYLVETDWQGTICIEHEPYDRDPMPEVVRSLERVRQWLN